MFAALSDTPTLWESGSQTILKHCQWTNSTQMSPNIFKDKNLPHQILISAINFKSKQECANATANRSN